MAANAVPTRRHLRPVSRVLLAVVAMVTAIVSSSNWCFVGFAAAVAAPIADVLIDGIGVVERPGKAMSFIIRLAIAVVVGVAVGWLLRASPAWAFREAMDSEIPAGVRVTRVQRHYEGGPGEHTLIVEFKADASVITSMLSDEVVEASAKSDRITRWSAAGRTWEGAMEYLDGPAPLPFSKMTWSRVHPLQDPQAYDFGVVNNGHLILLYEPASGRGVMLHRRS